MSEFEREQPNYRLVATHHGDDLQAVATRELGDANRWPELIWLNDLVWPYLTDDSSRVAPGVVLNGGLIKVQAPSGFTENKTGSDDVYETDAVLQNKLLQADDLGDFSIVSGVDNLKQQLSNAVNTPRGQARRHPEYGCMVWRLLGTVNGPTAGALGAAYVKATLKADYRVNSVSQSSAEIVGDTVRIVAQANAVVGGEIEVRTDSSRS